MDYRALTAELRDDPLARGYSGMMTNAEVAADLNTVNRAATVDSITGQDLLDAVTPADRNALSAADRSLLHALIGMEAIPLGGTNTKASLLSMFGAATDSRANLEALETRPVSRGEELGLGTVTGGNVGSARIVAQRRLNSGQ